MTITEQWGGHFQAGGSDKVWAAAYTTDGQLLNVWGRRGSALQRLTELGLRKGRAYLLFLTHVPC